jgi:hypothetical protein
MFDPVTVFIVATVMVTAADKYTEAEARRKRVQRLRGKKGKAKVITVPMEVGDARQAKRFENSEGYRDFKDMVKRGRYIRDGA